MNLSAGLGDAIVNIPAIKLLKKNYEQVDGYFLQSAPLGYFKELGFLDNLIVGRNRVSDLRLLLGYDLFFSDFLINKYFILASILSISPLKILSSGSSSARNYSQWLRLIPTISLMKMNKADHISRQLCTLVDEHYLMELNRSFIEQAMEQSINAKFSIERYGVVQISSGDALTCYKNWSIENWQKLLKKLTINYPSIQWLLLGGSSESELNSFFREITNVQPLIGMTTISDAYSLIKNAACYLGVDSGLMHMAAATGIPTISIWGPTCINSYGYEKLNPNMHRCISLRLDCSPCHSHINENKSRVLHYMDCTSRDCLLELSVEDVMSQVEPFLEEIL